MSPRLELLGPDRVVEPKAWPDGTPAPVRIYLSSITENGPTKFLKNAGDAACHVLVAERGEAIPVIVASGIGSVKAVAALLSPRRWHLYYPVEGAAKRARFLREGVMRTALSPLGLIFAAGHLDRVVFLNHWLIVASPQLTLTAEELAAATELLTRRFPDHAIVVPHIVPALGGGAADILRTHRFGLIRSRIVHLLDPISGRFPKRDLREGRSLIKRAEQARLGGSEALLRHVSTLARLYERHFIAKHSAFNPHYTEAFFRLALTSGLLEGEGWTGDGGDLVAYSLWFPGDRSIVISLSAYDGAYEHALERRRGLFRLVCAWDLEVAIARGQVLNWGAGNDHFKGLRGARPAVSYDAVFDHHLPARRRLPWRLLRALKGLNERLGRVELPSEGEFAPPAMSGPERR